MQKEKGFKPTFENGGFWEYYKDLERQFQNYLHYVPYVNGNECTYSYRLVSLLISTVSYIDSAFKEVAKYPQFAQKHTLPKKPNIGNYYSLALELSLPEKLVTFKRLPERELIRPYSDFRKIGKNTTSPGWWTINNNIKHELGESFGSANLRNVRDALAGAFLINVVYPPSAIRLYEYGVLKTRMPYAGTPGVCIGVSSTYGTIKDCLENRKTFSGDVETSLFKFSYQADEQSD